MAAYGGNHHGNKLDATAVIRDILQGRDYLALPPESAAEQAAGYRQTLGDYRRHSLEYLTAGDYQQAAEKAWGGYAESVKSIGADYGVKLAHHAYIIRVGSRLATLAGQAAAADEPVLRLGLSLARGLHQHFYENDLQPEDVIFSVHQVAAAVGLMQQRFGLDGGNGAAPEGA